MGLVIYFRNLKSRTQIIGLKNNYILVTMHLQLVQDKLVSEHLSSQRVSNPKIALMFVKCKKFFLNLDLAHSQLFKLF
jgi:hypothetical protein